MITNFLDKVSNILNINLKYLVRSSFWVGLENIISLILGLIVVYAMANFIEPKVAGEYKYIISIAAIISTFTLTGVAYAVIRETALGYDSFFRYATRKALLWSLLPITISTLMMFYYFLNDNFLYGFSIFLATFFTIMISNFSLYRSYLIGKEKYRDLTIYGNAVSIITTIVSVITFYFTENLAFLILGTIGMQFLVLMYIYFLIKKDIPNSLIQEEQKQKFDKYAYSQSFVNIIAVSATHLDKVILFKLLGPVELAIYTFSLVVPDKIKGLLKTFSNVLFPKYVKRNFETSAGLIFKEGFVFFLLLLPVTIIVFYFTPYIFNLFLPKYIDYIYLSQIYTLTLFSALAILPYSLIQAKNLVKELYYYEIFNSSIQIIFVVLGVMYLGLLGAVLGKAISSLFNTMVLYLYIIISKK